MALISTLTDDFNAASINTTLWTVNIDSGGFPSSGAATQSGGKLRVKATSISAFDNEVAVSSNSTYDLTNDGIVFRPTFGAAPTTGKWEAGFQLRASAQGRDAASGGNNTIAMVLERDASAGDTFYRTVFDNGGLDTAQTSGGYSATNDAWWRIRYSGSNILWDTAPDSSGVPGTWTNRASWPVASITGFSLTTVRVDVHFRVTGNLNAATNAWMDVDVINPVTAVTHAATGALTGPGAAVAGTARRFRAHAATGALAGPGSVLAGTAARVGAPTIHATSGALAGPGAVLAGVAKITRSHAATGALVAPGAVLAGTARIGTPVVHSAVGVLVADGAVLAGLAARDNPNKLSSVRDDFSGGALDAAKWSGSVFQGTGTITQTGGKLVLNPTSSASGDGIAVRNLTAKTIVNDRVFIRLTQPPRSATNAEGIEARFEVEASLGNAIGWYPQSDGSIQAQRRVGGVVQDNMVLSYTPTTHAWLGMMESGGQFYLQTAPLSASDPPLPSEWITRYQIATADIGFAVTSVKMVLACVVWWNQAGAPAQPASFDCVNSRSVGPVTHAATGALAGSGAVLAGRASKKITHVASGALPGQAATLAGAFSRRHEHIAVGALVGPSAIISANGSTSDVTRKVWFDTQDTAGAWSETPQPADPWTMKDDTSGSWGSK